MEKFIYTLEDVKHINLSKKKKLILKGYKIYDVTEFIYQHPGGINSINKRIGKDCTEDFNWHSKGSQKMWGKYHIGYLEGYSEPWKCIIS